MTMLFRFFHAVCRRPIVVLVCACAIACACGIQIPHLNIDLALAQRFMGGGDAVHAYEEFRRTFGREASIVVMVETDEGSMWSRDAIDRSHLFATDLAGVPGVVRVTGLDSLAALGADASGLRRLPIVAKLFGGRDDRHAAILVELDDEMLAPSAAPYVVDVVEDVAHRHTGDGMSFVVAGPVVLQAAAVNYARRDLAMIMAIVIAAVAIVLGIAFRSWVGVAAPLLVAVLSLFIVLGILAMTGIDLSQFAFIAIPVFVGLSVLDGIHIVHAWHECASSHGRAPCMQGDGAGGGMEGVLLKELAPCLLTSLTTLIGFAALVASPLEQVRSIGLVIAIGVPVSFVLSFTVLPSMLACASRSACRQPMRDPFAVWSGRLADFVCRRRIGIVVVFGVISLVAIAGVARLSVALDFPRIFRAGDPVQETYDAVERNLGGGASFEIMLGAVRPGGFRDPETVKRVIALSQALNLSANVAATVSFVDAAASYLMARETDLRTLKWDADVIDAIAAAIRASPAGEVLLGRWVTPDFGTARIHVKLTTEHPELHDTLESALSYLSGSFAGWFTIRPTGFAYLCKRMEHMLFMSFLATFVYAFVGVAGVIMTVALARGAVPVARSVAGRVLMGLGALAANLVPIGIVLGIMGWAGQPLSLGVVMLPAVGLGLLTDDTIHFLVALKRAGVGGDGRAAVERAYRETGWPIVMTQLVLLAAFGSLVVSHFAANVTLGIFMSLLLVIGLMFDLFFMPALFLMGGRMVRPTS